ncbi:MAG TPA: NAD(P)H-binding protein [Euzebyales bacterium]|nr:NAD(P)H-binding protein [Euzebyales bacterium]
MTGATGVVGGTVVRLLAAGTDHEVTALVRPEPAAGELPAGVGHRIADHHDPPALAQGVPRRPHAGVRLR